MDIICVESEGCAYKLCVRNALKKSEGDFILRIKGGGLNGYII